MISVQLHPFVDQLEAHLQLKAMEENRRVDPIKPKLSSVKQNRKKIGTEWVTLRSESEIQSDPVARICYCIVEPDRRLTPPNNMTFVVIFQMHLGLAAWRSRWVNSITSEKMLNTNQYLRPKLFRRPPKLRTPRNQRCNQILYLHWRNLWERRMFYVADQYSTMTQGSLLTISNVLTPRAGRRRCRI